VDENARFSRSAGIAVIVHQYDLGLGDCLADRGRAPVELRDREIGRAKRLGEAVHQHDVRLRLRRAEARQRRERHRSAAVGQVAEARKAARGMPASHASTAQSPGTPAARSPPSPIARTISMAEPKGEQDRRRALLDGGEELVQL
jgi:hypothetical protein